MVLTLHNSCIEICALLRPFWVFGMYALWVYVGGLKGMSGMTNINFFPVACIEPDILDKEATQQINIC